MRWRAATVLAALWWGSLSTVAFLAVPLLFAHLPTPALAGQTAARLFSAQSWVSLGCGLLLMLLSMSKRGQAPVEWARPAMIFIAGGILLSMLVEHAVAPRIVARVDLRFWHSLGTGMLLAQWLCATAAFWKIVGAGASPAGDVKGSAGAS